MGRGKKLAAELLKAIANNEIEAVICRAPEFYGPGKQKESPIV
jgi:nucleoside-diphosphate-sugar epimerase